MFLTRDGFAVALAGDLTPSLGDRVVQLSIVRQGADRLVPRSHFPFARKLLRFERHPLGDRHDAATAAVVEIAADNVWKRSSVADDRWNRIDHRFGRDAAER